MSNRTMAHIFLTADSIVTRILATIIHSFQFLVRDAIVPLESSEIVSLKVHSIDKAMHCRTCVDIFTRIRETYFNQMKWYSKYWLSYSTLGIYWSFGAVPFMHPQNTTSIDSSAVCVDTVLSLFFFSPSAFWLTYSFSFVRIIQWWYQVAESGTLWALFLFYFFLLLFLWFRVLYSLLLLLLRRRLLPSLTRSCVAVFRIHNTRYTHFYWVQLCVSCTAVSDIWCVRSFFLFKFMFVLRIFILMSRFVSSVWWISCVCFFISVVGSFTRLFFCFSAFNGWANKVVGDDCAHTNENRWRIECTDLTWLTTWPIYVPFCKDNKPSVCVAWKTSFPHQSNVPTMHKSFGRMNSFNFQSTRIASVSIYAMI